MSTILVVEDDRALCSFLVDVLEDEGYTVVTCHDGLEGLMRLETLHPDLIFTDVMMPNLDGVELCRYVQANPVTRHIPIIVCSAGRQDAFADRCDYAAFLSKPFDLDALLETVGRYAASPA
ncbi:MAG TPA: response regulator [Herpetosiphonaceae bacterium]|nr:response regulator [Herpetosiphonaceae bacterium]